MKKIIIPTFTILLTSCSGKSTTKWESASASKTCFDNATKGKYDLEGPQLKRIEEICDCVAQKMVSTFKTEEEANNKMLDQASFINDCKEEWQKKAIENIGK